MNLTSIIPLVLSLFNIVLIIVSNILSKKNKKINIKVISIILFTSCLLVLILEIINIILKN
ncbi:MAG: hypothetical protein ACI4WW_06665 [Candidatus Coprovivens sp.]